MRLIDADALKDRIFSKWGMHPKYMTSMSFNAEQDCYVLEVLNSAPTIEAVPIEDYRKLHDEMMQPHSAICPYCMKRFYTQQFRTEVELNEVTE
jgi:hypothetical protein